jgi:ABC-type multidrug transport system ATPase subunit
VLYDDLTVEEHLNLVCSIKDVKEHRVVRDIDDTLELVMLQQHREKKVKELSGGMKRKLSLGMALLG